MRILREGVIYENITLKEFGNTVVAGHVIAQHGRLESSPLCIQIDENGNDITLYKTIENGGVKEQVPDVQPVEDITQYTLDEEGNKVEVVINDNPAEVSDEDKV